MYNFGTSSLHKMPRPPNGSTRYKCLQDPFPSHLGEWDSLAQLLQYQNCHLKCGKGQQIKLAPVIVPLLSKTFLSGSFRCGGRGFISEAGGHPTMKINGKVFWLDYRVSQKKCPL